MNEEQKVSYNIVYIDNAYAVMRGIEDVFLYSSEVKDFGSPEFQTFIEKHTDNLKFKVLKVSVDVKVDDAMIFDYIYENNKTTVYIDLDNTIFDYNKAYMQERELHPDMEFPQSQKGFFENLEPLPRAIEVVKALIDSGKYNIFFASAPSYYNPHSYTDKRLSIEKHFGFSHVDKLILICKKDELKDDNRILIDDIESGYGQENYTNHLVFGKKEGDGMCPDWDYVESKLL